MISLALMRWLEATPAHDDAAVRVMALGRLTAPDRNRDIPEQLRARPGPGAGWSAPRRRSSCQPWAAIDAVMIGLALSEMSAMELA